MYKSLCSRFNIATTYGVGMFGIPYLTSAFNKVVNHIVPATDVIPYNPTLLTAGGIGLLTAVFAEACIDAVLSHKKAMGTTDRSSLAQKIQISAYGAGYISSGILLSAYGNAILPSIFPPT